MKFCLRVLAIFLTLILSLSACKKNETEFVLGEFNTTVSFCCNKEEYKGDFFMKSKDEMSFTVRSPGIINGCTFSYKNGETNLSFDGVTIDVRDASPVKALFDSLGIMAEMPHKINGNSLIIINDGSEATVNIDEMKIKELNTGDIVYIFS